MDSHIKEFLFDKEPVLESWQRHVLVLTLGSYDLLKIVAQEKGKSMDDLTKDDIVESVIVNAKEWAIKFK